jgi:hypothetical protein
MHVLILPRLSFKNSNCKEVRLMSGPNDIAEWEWMKNLGSQFQQVAEG